MYRYYKNKTVDNSRITQGNNLNPFIDFQILTFTNHSQKLLAQESKKLFLLDY